MTRQTSRRSILVGLAAVPIAAVPAVASLAPTVSSELARLIRKSEKLDASLKWEGANDEYPTGLIRAAGVVRRRVAAYPSAGLADVLAKARHAASVWGAESLQEEFDALSDGGHGYCSDMAMAVIHDLSRLAQA